MLSTTVVTKGDVRLVNLFYIFIRSEIFPQLDHQRKRMTNATLMKLAVVKTNASFVMVYCNLVPQR